MPPVDVTNYPSDIRLDGDGNVVVAVLGATNPPDNAGQVLRYALNEGKVEGTLLATLVNAYPPMGSIAWIRSPDAVTGDYDSDGAVDADDYNNWRADFGKWVANGGGGDGNGNGVIDSADYLVWRNSFGSGQPAGAGTGVPEPSTAMFLSAAISMLLVLRVRRSAILT
jgi:hypothetical protein